MKMAQKPASADTSPASQFVVVIEKEPDELLGADERQMR
jgi:hypothetical protein